MMKSIILIVISFTLQAGAVDEVQNLPFEALPLQRPDAYGAEIGNGAPYGGSELFCKNTKDFYSCYGSIQRILARARLKAERKKVEYAIQDLIFGMRQAIVYVGKYSTEVINANNSAKNSITYQNSSVKPQLLSYLERGLELYDILMVDCNKGSCTDKQKTSIYLFFQSYYSLLLEDVYPLDLAYYLPLLLKQCIPGTNSNAFEYYYRLQLKVFSQLLRLTINSPVNDLPVRYGFSIENEAIVTSKIFDFIVSDMNGFLTRAFVRIPISELAGISAEIEGIRQKANANYHPILDLSSHAANHLIEKFESYKFEGDMPIMVCGEIKK